MATTSLILQIAPQRSTQYARLARDLAPHELELCPLGPRIDRLLPVQLGGQEYLTFELSSSSMTRPSRNWTCWP